MDAQFLLYLPIAFFIQMKVRGRGKIGSSRKMT